MISKETVLAYVDGELSHEEALTVEAAMTSDPALAEEVARHLQLRDAAGGAFAAVLTEPVPERLLAAAREAPSERVARSALVRRFGPPHWAAMAACLALGVLAGYAIPSGPVVSGAGGLQARGALARALDGKLAADEGPVRMGVSFRDAGRAYCRTFRMDREALAGLACREDGRWAVRTLAEVRPQAGGDYQMAGSAMPPAVLAAMDQMMVGDPLDRTEETAARAGGWK